jgi:hypothetical protein
MMTRSGNFYGQIPEEWKDKACEILYDFDKVHKTYLYVMNAETRNCFIKFENILASPNEDWTWFSQVINCLFDMMKLLRLEDPEWTKNLIEKMKQ